MAGWAGAAALVYVVLATVVSLVFMAGAAVGLASLILVQLALFGLFAAVAAAMYWAAARKASSDSAIERRADAVYGLLARAEALLRRLPAGSPEARSLERSIEEIRYFDKNSSVPTDRLIAERLMDLDEIYSPAGAPSGNAPRHPAPDGASSVLESLDAAAGGGASPPAPAPPATGTDHSPDPAAQKANAEQLLEELYRLTLRRKDESLASKRGSL
jgi:hypothetical protein